ncbi:MAG TPA: hypothetical protein P5136_01540 [Methanofastidiosum sp.]|nr:hypothetical protein [Methanofastidiosum sp.]
MVLNSIQHLKAVIKQEGCFFFSVNTGTKRCYEQYDCHIRRRIDNRPARYLPNDYAKCCVLIAWEILEEKYPTEFLEMKLEMIQFENKL